MDIDPERPAEISSTDEEHTAALELARRIREILRENMGWPEPILGDSGNGGHLAYRIDIPNDEEAKTLCQRVPIVQGYGMELVYPLASLKRLDGAPPLPVFQPAGKLLWA